jgi:hypothetical protein
MYAMPVMYRPDGRVYTSISLIDHWILARAEDRWASLADKSGKK